MNTSNTTSDEHTINYRRILQIILGLLWIGDGLLQLQPKMFTSQFATQVLAPMAQGQPTYIGHVIRSVSNLIAFHPAQYTIIFASTQLLIGSLLLIKRTIRIGILLSIVWGTSIWIIGEGLGGLFNGTTMLLMGSPGAVLLYIVIAISCWPSDKNKHVPDGWLAIFWGFMWVGTSLMQLRTSSNPVRITSMILQQAQGAPHWLAYLDHIAVHVLLYGGYGGVLLLLAIQISIGLFIFAPQHIRERAIYLGIGVSVIYWIIGQNLGGYYTGLMTDINTAPLVIVLGFAIRKTSEDYTFTNWV